MSVARVSNALVLALTWDRWGTAPAYTATAEITVTSEDDPRVRALTDAAIGTTVIATVRWQAQAPLEGGFYLAAVDPPPGWRPLAMGPKGRCCSLAWNGGAVEADEQVPGRFYELGALVPAAAEGELHLVFNARPKARSSARGPWRVWLLQEDGNDLLAVQPAVLER